VKILLLDQGLPRSSLHHLASAQIVAHHVGDRGLAAASDEAILQEALSLGAIVVTLDADFHSLLAASGASKPSVIRSRIEGLKGEGTAKIIEQVAATAAADLIAGAAISVAQKRIAIRRLPLKA
jgi:predicted nuclease of predicted toxin-antitoxin system